MGLVAFLTDSLGTRRKLSDLRAALRQSADVQEVEPGRQVNPGQFNLVRGAILTAKQDVLEGRAKRRRKELQAIALAV